MDTIHGTTGGDQINGSSGADLIYGHMGDDTINGNGGQDIIFGGQGNDIIAGSGIAYGNLGDDTISNFAGTVFGGQGNDVISATGLVYGNLGNDSLTVLGVAYGGQGNDYVSGSAGGSSVIYGNMGDDTLVAGNVGDVLYGGQGNDLMINGAGADTFQGGLGDDTVRYAGSASAYFVQRVGDDVLVTNNGVTDLLRGFGIGNDVIEFDNTQITTPGDTVYVPYPVPGPVVDKPDVKLSTFGDLSKVDSRFVNASGNLLFGDGTTSPRGELIVTDPTSGVTLAIAQMPRQGDPAFGGGQYMPTAVSFDGVTAEASYTLPSGSESTTNGSFANAPTQGATIFPFTFGSSKQSIADLLTGGYQLNLTIDRDPSATVDPLVLHAVVNASGGIDLNQANGAPGITDNTSTANAFANSEQSRFFVTGGLAALQPGAQLDIGMQVIDPTGTLVAGILDHVTLGPAGFSPANQTS